MISLQPEDREVLFGEFDARWFERARKRHFESARAVTKKAAAAEAARDATNIVGYGFGEKVTDSRYTGDRALTVYVQKKVPRASLPQSLRIPATIAGIPTDVQETGRFRAMSEVPPSLGSCISDPEARQPRPFPAGVSIGGGRNAAGTLGYAVTLEGFEEICALSNYHVLGDMADPTKTPPVLQPGNGDATPDPKNVVGAFVGGIPLRFDGTANEIDAAFCAMKPGTLLPALCSIGRIRAVDDPVEDDVVRLYGKSSRFSVGVVKQPVASVVVSYGRQKALFVNQWLILPMPPSTRFARHGDSGALLVKQQATATALLFSASLRHGYGLATPITRVLGQLKLRFVQ